MLWDIIRDFIVQYLTGGTDSVGNVFDASIGYGDRYTNDIVYQVGSIEGVEYTPYYTSLGDWLATTITAVIMILFVVFAVWLIRWIFKAVSSAFLLK